MARFSIGGDGGTDYLTAEPGTGRVFVSRGTHVMVVDGATGKVLGDIPDTPRMHGIALAPKPNHGFTTNAGDSTVTMFDLKTLAVIKKITVPTGGLDGIMYDDFSDRIILDESQPSDRHARSRSMRTAGDIVGTAELEDNAPEGAASDGKGRLFVNNEGKNTIQVLDAKTMKVLASWPLAPCDGPTGIAYDRADEPDLLGLRQDVGGGRREDRQGRRDDHQRRRRGRARLGSGAEADLHSRRPRWQRHGGAPGLARQVHAWWRRCRRCRGAKTITVDPVTPRGLSLPARVRARARAGARLGAARGGIPRTPRTGDRHLVLRDQPLTSSKEPAMSGVRVLVGTRKGAFILTSDGKREEVGRQRAALCRVGDVSRQGIAGRSRTGSTRRSRAAGSGS